VTEARALARKYLALSEARVRSAKSDAERFEAAYRVQRAAMVMAAGEGAFPLAGRFRNCTDLIADAETALATAASAPVPQDRLADVQNVFGVAYSGLLWAAVGVKSRAELAHFIQAHADRLAAEAVTSPEMFFAGLDRKVDDRDRITPEAVQRVARVAGRFICGYVKRDAAAIAATTRLSAAEASRRFKDNDLTFFAGTEDRVTKIDFQPVSAEWLAPHRIDVGDFLVYLPDVEMQLVAPDGTPYSKTVDRTMYLHAEPSIVTVDGKKYADLGHPVERLDVYIDTSRAERARIRQ